ncbi:MULTISPECIES: S-adenosylmethionine decarboxylase [unclassified Saccharicrinis]|uniref:S-adenosylmethionine decarboxylase n=1 Tax=unclassified Saccharicrinis TaxID=2646859 RepID=UPI003D358D7B
MKTIQHKQLPPQIFNLKGWMNLVDEVQLKETFGELLVKSGFNVLDYSSHQFPVNGFTAFWLLAESHLALHTFTENGWCYIELSSCNQEKTIKFRAMANALLDEVRWDEEIKNCEPGKKTELSL